MTQPQRRFRNELRYAEDMARRRSNVARASGDSTATTICQRQDILAKSQDKLPRSVRNELENALIALCDVWFDEIKPHLVRNNIKLHVKGRSSSAGGDQSARTPPPAPSLHRAPPSSPPSEDCSHLDPGAVPDRRRRGASCASCWPPPPAASRALATRLRAPLRRPLSPVISMPATPRDGPQIQIHDCEKKQGRLSVRRKRRRFRAQSQSSWRVPRPCRTYPALSRGTSGAGGPASVSTSQLPPCEKYYRFIVPRRKSVMKNKTTQTEPALRMSKACQSHSPVYCSSELRSPGQRSPAPCNKKHNLTSSSPDSGSPKSGSPGRALSPLVPPPPVTCRLKRPEVTAAALPPLMKDDLIDIIAASNEQRLKLLYSSSETDDRPSFLSLFPNCKPEKMSLKKLPPWR